jgi:hypothetical protein
MRPWIPAIVALSVAIAAPAAAQVATVDPGMNRAEVIQVLGKPNGERTSGQYTYLFYRNNCEVRCGMQDLVILQNDLVVDAIFRSNSRTYSGASSSPNGVTPEASGSGSLRTNAGAEGAGAGNAGADRRGGIVSSPASPNASETPTTNRPASAGRATVTGAGVVSTPASANRAATPARGMDSTKVLDNVPLNPRDTNTIQPSRTQGQLTPSARDQQPVPFSGSKPSPRDSAVKAKTGQKPDTVKPPKN